MGGVDESGEHRFRRNDGFGFQAARISLAAIDMIRIHLIRSGTGKLARFGAAASSKNIGGYLAIVLLAALAACSQPHKASAAMNVTRATLANGLRVVIVRDPLAPVVTVEENYLAGGDETPSGFPGMAHAQEHMAFRGCANLSGDQIAAINAQLGGFTNADTQQNITQYFNTVPAEYLDLVLRMDASCMRDVEDSQAEWAKERGGIEQEVASDLSDPTEKFIARLNEDLFAGTPYAHDALGTQNSFDRTTAAMLKDFYKQWYAPNNAILVITGDVDPGSTIKRINQLYGSIPRRRLPGRPEVKLRPVTAESFTMESDLPYQIGVRRIPHAGQRQPGLCGGACVERRPVERERRSVRPGDPGPGARYVV